ncbi:MAG: hypothetical protein JO034_09085 [Singulisphaera sp.]|nr:hypothetical protein [Singulisphaera sp.]
MLAEAHEPCLCHADRLAEIETGYLQGLCLGIFSGGGLLLDAIDKNRPLDDLGQQQRSVQRSPTL